MDLIAKLRNGRLTNFGGGYNGEFFGKVADELERSHEQLELYKNLLALEQEENGGLRFQKNANWELCVKEENRAYRYKSTLGRIGRIATGEDQVADDDTEGMAQIAKLVAEAVRG